MQNLLTFLDFQTGITWRVLQSYIDYFAKKENKKPGPILKAFLLSQKPNNWCAKIKISKFITKTKTKKEANQFPDIQTEPVSLWEETWEQRNEKCAETETQKCAGNEIADIK